MDGYDELILIDTVQRGDAPGALYVLAPDVAAGSDPMDAHDMNPEAVLAVLQSLGGRLSRVTVVGCEPAAVEEGIGLSDPVAGAVDQAIRLVLDLLDERLEDNDREAGEDAETTAGPRPGGRGGVPGGPVLARPGALPPDQGHVRRT